MKFTYRKKQYELDFTHGTETNEIPGHGQKEQRFTTARITELGTGQILGEGKVHRYYRDADNHETARKESLRVATAGIRNRNFRRVVWNFYNTRPGGILFNKTDEKTVTPKVATATA